MHHAGLGQGWCTQAPWLLMIETDYVWMKPLQAPPAEDAGAASLGFPFGYIIPGEPRIEGVMRKMYPVEKGPLSDVPGSGPAPVLMRVHEWIKVHLCFALFRWQPSATVRLLWELWSYDCNRYSHCHVGSYCLVTLHLLTLSHNVRCAWQ